MRARDFTLAVRGFHAGPPAARRHLEQILGAFVDGYHAALDDGRPQTLGPRLNAVAPELRGFAFEGAGLCLAAFDLLTPWKRDRWVTFLQGPGQPQSMVLHVAFGLALGAFGRRPEEGLKRLVHPGERWLAVDGYAFYEGFFRWRHYVQARAAPSRLSGYARRVFDQGLGRCLWFGGGADVDYLAQTVAAFPHERRGDLWSGLGVACTFAGGVGEAALKTLCQAAAPYGSHLRMGSVFAALLRQRAGIVVEHTERACQVVCGLSVAEAVRLVDAAFEGLPVAGPGDPPELSYVTLRRRVQNQLAPTEELQR